MKDYIFGKRNLIHIIDIRETVKGVLRAKKYINRIVSQGGDVLFVGTKRQARSSVMAVAQRTGMPCVVERWLGGTLTNFRTIRSRLARLEELEAIEASGMTEQYSKKMIATLNRERRKIKRNLDGIRNMNKLPGVIVLIDVRREHIASREARKLGIPVIALIDTDSDPDNVDIPIPGNDDAMRAIELVLEALGDAVEEGRRARPVDKDSGEAGQGSQRTARRSRRVTARAADAEAPADKAEGPESTASTTPPEGSPVAST